MSFPFEEIYHIYLSHLEDENYKNRYLGHEDKYGMSRAGQCFLKHYYFRHKYERFPLDELRKQRVPRLGQLFHADMETALDMYKDSPEMFLDKIGVSLDYHPMNCNIITERMVVDDGRRGHVDIYMTFVNKNKLEVYDLKTINSFGWRVRFGKSKFPDTNRFNHKQLATYTSALMNNLGITEAEMFLVYHNKDTGLMKTVPVSSDYFKEAENYWTDLKAFMRSAKDDNFINNVVPYEFIMVPVEKWECSWCSYFPHCNQIINNVGR